MCVLWKKDQESYDHNRFIDYFLMSLIVLVVSAVIFRQMMLFVAIGFMVTYLILYYLYEKTLTRKIKLKDRPTSIRLFPEEKMKLSFEIENRSLFPIFNGKLTLQIASPVQAYTYILDEEEYWKEPVHIYGSIPPRSQMRIKLPLLAKKRGVAKVNHIQYSLPHLFNYRLMTLRYGKRHETEIIVYPELLPVSGIQILNQMTPGMSRYQTSPFEDIQEPVTIRDYQQRDPFHRINWKASAKSLTLQTNVYERVINRSFLFLVNVESPPNHYVDIEHVLSYTAYLSEYATKQNIPYEIYLNAFKVGEIPFIHLPMSEGKVHFRNTLEMLARLKRMPVTYSFEQMVQHVLRYNQSFHTVVIIGLVSEETRTDLSRIGIRVFHIHEADDGAYLKPLVTSEVVKHA